MENLRCRHSARMTTGLLIQGCAPAGNPFPTQPSGAAANLTFKRHGSPPGNRRSTRTNAGLDGSDAPPHLLADVYEPADRFCLRVRGIHFSVRALHRPHLFSSVRTRWLPANAPQSTATHSASF